MGKHSSYWTKEETELLIELWPKTEIEITDLVKIFNRTNASINAKANSLGLPTRSSYMHSNINREYLEKIYKVIDG